METVLKRQPDVIVLAATEAQFADWTAAWMRRDTLEAVKNRRFVHVNPDYLHRAGPRFALGVEALCRRLTAGY
jgi:ABC-type Fe3+-hydroxamate transport system substrate-binding protein